MSTIGGVKREVSAMPEFEKKVGLFEARVVAINPDAEELNALFGITVDEENKMVKYLDTTPEGNTKLRVDIWLEEVKNKDRFKFSIWLEDKVRESKDGLKKQYINEVGLCSWAADPNSLGDWFKKREYREAHVGEENLYTFLRTWLGNLDYSNIATTLEVSWNKLMRNNLNDLKSQINGEWSTNILALATIETKEKDGEVKEYQRVWSKLFLPAYTMKQFRLVDYHNDQILKSIHSRNVKDLSTVEKFVKEVTGEYGCRDYYRFRELEKYDPEMNVATSDKVISDDGSDF